MEEVRASSPLSSTLGQKPVRGGLGISGVPILYTLSTHYGYRTDSISASSDLDPSIRPPMGTIYRVLVWLLGIQPLLGASGGTIRLGHHRVDD